MWGEIDLGAAVKFSVIAVSALTWGWGWLELVLKFPVMESRIVEEALSVLFNVGFQRPEVLSGKDSS